MPFYTSLEEVGKRMDDYNARYWRVWNSDKAKVGELMVGKDITIGQSFTKLKDLLDNASGDYVTIIIFRNPPNRDEETGEAKAGGNTVNKFTYRVVLNGGGRQSESAPVRGIFGQEYYDRIMGLERQMIEQRFQYELDKRDREIADLKRELAEDPEIEGIDWQKEIIGLIKDHLIKDKVSKSLSFRKTEATPPIADRPEGNNLVAGTVESITGVLKSETADFLAAVKYAAENDPEGFKTISNAIISSVQDSKSQAA